MNIYDFDGTIYDGDSALDFWLYCIKRKPAVLKKLPQQISGFILYILRKTDKTGFKERFYSFLNELDNAQELVVSFWNDNENKIKRWYLEQKRDDDIIISASPQFLLKVVCDGVGIKNLIASRVDIKTGICEGKNCKGAEKVERLKAEFPNVKIDNFYSDTLSDEPLARLASKSYIVKGDKLKKWI